MIDQCLVETRRPVGTRARRRGRKLRGARDACLLALGYTVGAASGELTGLKREKCDFGDAIGPGSVTFPDRPARSRGIPLVGPTRNITELWAAHHDGTGHLFYPISKYGKRFGEALTQSGLRDVVTMRYRALPRVDRRFSERPSPQALRSSFKALLVEAGTSDAIIRDLMGLRSRRTAGRDDQEADGRMLEALQKVARKTRPGERIPRPPSRRL